MAVDPWDPLADCSPEQRVQLRAYAELLLNFNQRVNLISRETEAEEEFEERHLVHALSLARKPFPAGRVVVDWGTGGGLPAIPLAIRFPEVQFHAVDSVGKKIHAVRSMARRLELANLDAWHGRAESWPGRAHYSISRAAAPLAALWSWHERVRIPVALAAAEEDWAPGLLCLKGGELQSETAALHEVEPALKVQLHPLEPLLGRPYFAEKYIVHVLD